MNWKTKQKGSFDMQLTNLPHIVKGYVTIQADGDFLGRFLTVCTRRNLDIWQIRHQGSGRLTANMSLDAFRVIRPVCRRTRTHLRIRYRRGLPFLFHRYRKRKAALIGVLLTLLFLWYTSCHIMGVTVLGNNRIPTETVLEHLARSGVAVGKTTNGIDAAVIRNRMMRDLEDLAWVGINVSGSRIYVEVVERLEQEPGVAMDDPCHLVATKDGVIDSIEARNGQNMVTVGSGVREGDVLVSGIMDAGTEAARYVHAYGEVFARTTYLLSRDYPLTYEDTSDTGKTSTRYTLRVLNKTIPLFLQKSPPYARYAKEESEQEYRLPIERSPSLFIKKERYREQTAEQKKRTAGQALQTAKKELETELIRSLPEGVSVLEKEITHTLTEQGSLSVTLTLTCKENIAKEVGILEDE